MILKKIINFNNQKIDSSIINQNQIENLVFYLLNVIEENIEGDITEFGCYVGESSKYLMKTLIETNSDKKLYLYDSFEGLPNLSKWEENTGWKSGTLKTSEEVLLNNFKINKLPLPTVHKDWFKNIPNNKIPEKISFAFLDGDFYDSIYDSLTKIYDKVQDGGYICFHDYKRNDLPGVNAAIQEFFRERNIEDTTVEVTTQLGVYRKNAKLPLIKVSDNFNKKNSNNFTLVTGLWDIKRDTLTDGWSRSFQHYLNKFEELLKIDENLIIFGDDELEKFVWERRSSNNTQFVLRPQSWFVNNDYYDKIQKIRQSPNWYNQSSWLIESTQAKLEMYNPLVMSKMFLLHDAKILDKFDSSHLFWIDAGITNTIHPGYFTHDKVLDKIKDKFNKFSFICFPYDGKVEIHGFEYTKMCQYSNQEVDMVARGGFFGGSKESISDINTLYYSLLIDTLSQGYMGTEESLFTILTYRHPDLINYYEIENNGLLGTFFENVKNDKLEIKNKGLNSNISNDLDTSKVGLYVITFNSPDQFETLVKSMLEYDSDFITKTKKFLLDNSTDLSTTPRYIELCEEYGFERISTGENLGITRGRVYIAEHFDTTDLSSYFFYEDDMSFYLKKGEVCRNGFNRYVPNLYQKSLEILKKENFDFLKLNFSEFYGSNDIQFAWYNTPQSFRETNWPEKPKLPVQGLDPNAPNTVFKNIKSHKGLPYASGEIYLCNWPILLSRKGNYKCYLETKFQSPFEQTLMSYAYQETIKGKINPGILLLTPTEHHRFHHYEANLRKEC